jgi:hypothetical protein
MKRLLGCGVVAIAVFLVGAGLLINWISGSDAVQDLAEMAGAPERESARIAGDPARFDPVAGLGQALALAGPGARLERLDAYGVRRDGTLDLTAGYTPAPRATYQLHRPAPAPDPAPPVGAGGSAVGHWYQAIRVEAYRPGQRRQVTSINGSNRVQYVYVNKGLDMGEGEVSGTAGAMLPPPACRFALLWEAAVEAGAPADAVAQIRYDEDGYSFNSPGIFNRRYGRDCRPRD